MSEKPKKKRIVVGTALLNIAEFANSSDENDFDLNIPITIARGSAQDSPLLCVSPFN